IFLSQVKSTEYSVEQTIEHEIGHYADKNQIINSIDEKHPDFIEYMKQISEISEKKYTIEETKEELAADYFAKIDKHFGVTIHNVFTNAQEAAKTRDNLRSDMLEGREQKSEKTPYSEEFLRSVSKAFNLSSEQLKMMVSAWHGSPYLFDKFTTEKIGTGEGHQAFGWGLYFTDKKDIADWYAKNLSKKYDVFIINGKELSPRITILLHEEGLIDNIEYANFNKSWFDIEYNIKKIIKSLEKDNENYKKQTDKEYFNKLINRNNEDIKNLQLFIDVFRKEGKNWHSKIKIKLKSEGKIYKILLHKGKSPSEYDYIEWNKFLTKSQINKIIKQFIKEKLEFEEDIDYNFKVWAGRSGAIAYHRLIEELGSPKEASLFLLRAGIDGIKYSAGTLSNIKDSGAYNYVVFDENAVTIEEVIQFMNAAAIFGTTEEDIIQLKKEFDAVKSKYENTDKWLKAPNGNPTNLSEHLWVMVRTPRFKNWFGDWENSPETASKVVDANGEPLVVYHGTDENINKINVFKKQEKREGYYFIQDIKAAKTYGENIIPVFLNIKNPLNKNFNYSRWDRAGQWALLDGNDELINFYNNYQEAENNIPQKNKNQYTIIDATDFETILDYENQSKKENKDGGIMLNVSDINDTESNEIYSNVFFVFSPNQIKSISNVGSFGETGDIRYMFAGEESLKNLPEEEKKIAADNLQVAKQMQSQNLDSDKIRLATGWYLDKDNKWKYEISDEDLKFAENFVYERIANKNRTFKLNNVIDHQKLFETYPQLKNIAIVFTDDLKAEGNYDAENKIININYAIKEGKNIKTTLLHEIQHAIQDIEGFAMGGSPENILNEKLEKIKEQWFNNEIDSETYYEKRSKLIQSDENIYFQEYKRLLGEMEARETAYRTDLTAEQRKALQPYQLVKEREGIDVKDAIVLFDNGEVQQAIGLLESVKTGDDIFSKKIDLQKLIETDKNTIIDILNAEKIDNVKLENSIENFVVNLIISGVNKFSEILSKIREMIPQ
ncbi:hypothetical protein KA977_14780, partial [Candidatus Dependentiae bacterium]|nr:hypothetical protein [Candidatus Dependentiae bacterium]